MIALFGAALLATICAGQNASDFFLYRSYNPELWPKLPKGSLHEYLKLRPEHEDAVQKFPRVFPCIDENEDAWPEDVKICIAEIWKNGRARFWYPGLPNIYGPRGEILKYSGDIDPKYGICVLYEMVSVCFLRKQVIARCGVEAFGFAHELLLTPSQKPAKVQESCNSRPDVTEREKRQIVTRVGFGQLDSMRVPVRRRFVTETPKHIQQCLDSNYGYFMEEVDWCSEYENRKTGEKNRNGLWERIDRDYELCLFNGKLDRCFLTAVEERCGTLGVLSSMDRGLSEMDFQVWASCTVRPAYVYTVSPPGVKFLPPWWEVLTPGSEPTVETHEDA